MLPLAACLNCLYSLYIQCIRLNSFEGTWVTTVTVIAKWCLEKTQICIEIDFLLY